MGPQGTRAPPQRSKQPRSKQPRSKQPRSEQPRSTDRPRSARSTPGILVALAALGLGLFVLPLVGLVVRALTESGGVGLGSPAVRSALGLSLLVSLAATALAFVLGFPLAFVLARLSFPGRRLVRAVVTLPMVLPPVVAGVALLGAFGRRGLFGPVLEALGVELAFTAAGAVLAATFVAAPFLIVTLEAALEAMDPRLEQAAATLGASPWRILWTVTLPTIRPALLAGLALCWARALGEFGATITFAGNVAGRTQTLPLAVYETLQSDYAGALQLSGLLLFISLGVLFALRGHLLAGRRP